MFFLSISQFHGFTSQFKGKDFVFDAENWLLECWKDFVNFIFQFGCLAKRILLDENLEEIANFR